ncbi:radical SAM protein [Dehalogenimonas alkenigignens]|uniref:Pyruvate-formate lyase-activating enzyme n=1 Tax=Dehalogenimonas alkenigignens TaxID=1217799 RepID=A0A0W0GH49_9CHLR|nr:radical SAM protein [Dehalogenimonas alkenigignens]KTB47888.1 Pyruvate-formate lyase-activating enzyme [Dehalogenimonas alkenigignens]PVV83917.1 radical SAM protein [Dehalogenimonas alkenigignens]
MTTVSNKPSISVTAKKPENSLCVYHVVYEPTFKSIIFHHWTECNLKCRGCYCRREKIDFSLLPDWQVRLSTNPPESPPEVLLSLSETLKLIEGLAIDRAIFIGVEPTLDPGLPRLAHELKSRYGSYNILFTNAVSLPDISDIDEIIVSLKAVTPELYHQYTEGENRKTLENFRRIYDSGKKLQAEITLIPGVIDAAEIEEAAKFISSINKDIPLRITGFIKLSGMEFRAPTGEEVETAARLAMEHLKTVNYLSGDMPRVGEPPVRLF